MRDLPENISACWVLQSSMGRTKHWIFSENTAALAELIVCNEEQPENEALQV